MGFPSGIRPYSSEKRKAFRLAHTSREIFGAVAWITKSKQSSGSLRDFSSRNRIKVVFWYRSIVEVAGLSKICLMDWSFFRSPQAWRSAARGIKWSLVVKPLNVKSGDGMGAGEKGKTLKVMNLHAHILLSKRCWWASFDGRLIRAHVEGVEVGGEPWGRHFASGEAGSR